MSPSVIPIKRAYDKGDRRYRHVNSKPVPEIVMVGDNPKRVIGKCPKGMPGSLLDALVNEAIPDGIVGQSDREFHKRLYVVHEGAIYEAQTSDQGKSYHGYPYRGILPSSLIDRLQNMADRKECRKDFDTWCAKHIKRPGSSRRG